MDTRFKLVSVKYPRGNAPTREPLTAVLVGFMGVIHPMYKTLAFHTVHKLYDKVNGTDENNFSVASA
jgi:hypothetical protein